MSSTHQNNEPPNGKSPIHSGPGRSASDSTNPANAVISDVAAHNANSGDAASSNVDEQDAPPQSDNGIIIETRNITSASAGHCKPARSRRKRPGPRNQWDSLILFKNDCRLSKPHLLHFRRQHPIQAHMIMWFAGRKRKRGNRNKRQATRDANNSSDRTPNALNATCSDNASQICNNAVMSGENPGTARV
jgi:hypothetical protein